MWNNYGINKHDALNCEIDKEHDCNLARDIIRSVAP
jgi:hypothetical protein